MDFADNQRVKPERHNRYKSLLSHDAFQVALRKFPFLSLAHLAEFQQDRHNKNDGLL